MNHAWLALDPGITTGWALLDDSGKILGSSVWGTGELRKTLDLLVRSCYSRGVALTAVVEAMPPGGHGPLARKLEEVRREIALVLEETYEITTIKITPGEWKTSRVARTTKLPTRWLKNPLTTHQKDTIRMGRYVIEKEKQT